MAELALYIHWPFCLSKCPYCDFNSHVRDTIDESRWRAALLGELDRTAAELPGRTVTSIFFGGGTPSLMAPATVAALLDRTAGHWPMAPDVEITLEANPTSVEQARLADIRAAGVNRVSLGVQALDDRSLKFLGRGHSAAEALGAVATAARLFDRFSFDLIYGRPGQTVSDWTAELRDALVHAGDHMSVYQLTLEEGTPFHALWRQGKLTPVEEDAAAALYEATQEVLEAAGMPAYEISNHAVPGGESRHNLTYWRYGDYAGIGPGAHGRITLDDGSHVATQRLRSPDAWLARVEARGEGMDACEPLDRDTRLTEAVLMGLRLSEGLPESRLRDIAGQGFADVFEASRLAALIDGGFLRRDGEWLRATAEGRARLNAVIAHLMA
jgi:putative oxygen-independent coproporphyrinogen III oxidase